MSRFQLWFWSYRRRLQVLLVFLAILAVLIFTPIIGMVLNFCISGRIPGTTIVLEPEMAMNISGLTVCIVLSTIGVTEHVRHMRRDRRRSVFMPQTRTIDVEPLLPVFEPIIIQKPHQVPALRYVFRSVRQAVLLIFERLLEVSAIVLSYIDALLLTLQPRIQPSKKRLQSRMHAVWRKTVYLGAQYWAVVEPMLWQIDGWIERRCKIFVKMAGDFLMRYELPRMMVMHWRQSRRVDPNS